MTATSLSRQIVGGNTLPADTQFLSPGDVARRWNMTVGTLANWRSLGRGPLFVRLGGRVRYPLSAVQSFELGLDDEPAAA